MYAASCILCPESMHTADGEDPVLGLAHQQVRLVEPTPQWATLFAEEATRLAAALQTFSAAIEHCGSTAVPGLPAKPILDILVGVPAPLDIPRLARALAPLSYEHAPGAVPGHEVFGKSQPRTHLLHVVPAGGEVWTRMVRFRDALRENPTLAREYAALKWALAAQFPTNRAAYTDGKAEFIARVLGESGAPGA
jgi:GrpB-like predicted nucleotidyltransferase (UPF0157 family)